MQHIYFGNMSTAILAIENKLKERGYHTTTSHDTLSTTASIKVLNNVFPCWSKMPTWNLLHNEYDNINMELINDFKNHTPLAQQIVKGYLVF